MDDLTIYVVITISVIILFSSIIKGITGFGTALFALPILTMLFLTPLEARPVIVSLNLMLNVFILLKERKLTFSNFNPIKLLVIPGFIAALLAGFFLPKMDLQLFSILLGILLILTAVNKLLNLEFTIKHYERYYIPMGILGGVLNTLIGAGGVPVLIFLSNTDMEKNRYRMTLLLFFFALNVGSIASFILNDAYPFNALILVSFLIPTAIIGSLIGMKVVHKINNQLFTKIVAVMLLIMGIDSVFNIF